MGRLASMRGPVQRRPRPGLAGFWARLIAPGAGPIEQAGAVAAASVGAIVGGLWPHTARERLLGAAFGFDAAGGIWVHETPAAKRWYRRPGDAPLEPAAFASLHVHPFLIEEATGRRSLWRASVAWALPVIATAMAAGVPEVDRRRHSTVLAVATGAVTTALAPAGWRWLPPLLAWKLVLAHATAAGPLDWLGSRGAGDGTGA